MRFSLLSGENLSCGTDGRMDRRTDRRTDQPTDSNLLSRVYVTKKTNCLWIASIGNLHFPPLPFLLFSFPPHLSSSHSSFFLLFLSLLLHIPLPILLFLSSSSYSSSSLGGGPSPPLRRCPPFSAPLRQRRGDYHNWRPVGRYATQHEVRMSSA